MKECYLVEPSDIVKENSARVAEGWKTGRQKEREREERDNERRRRIIEAQYSGECRNSMAGVKATR